MAVRARQPSRPSLPQVPQESGDQGVRVPNLVADPVWSLQPWPVVVELGGRVFEIPAHPASWWLSHLMNTELDLMDMFPGGLESEEQDYVYDMIMDGRLSELDFGDLVLDIIAAVSGRPWWVALRLVGHARGSWSVIGADMLLRGVDAARMSLAGWLDVALLTMVKNIDPKKVTMFNLELEQPPPGEGQGIESEPVMSASAFMSMG